MGRTMDALTKQPADELVGLRRFLERMESPGTTLLRNHIDITDSEINILNREIAYLDRIFAGIRTGRCA
jgi:hypothetical protein